METAISSSLSHPNIVQTFTYNIRSVKAAGRGAADDGRLASAKAAAAAAAAANGHSSMHDSSASVRSNAEAAAAANPGLGTGSDVHSWELRLVQEFCDRGSLRDALTAGTFRLAPAVADGAGGGGSSGGGGGGPAAPEPVGFKRVPLVRAAEVDFGRVLGTALDVARAMAHLHAQVCGDGGSGAWMGW
jgi:hypothetical protein